MQIYHMLAHHYLLLDSGGRTPTLLRTIYIDGSLYFVIVVFLRLTAAFIVSKYSKYFIVSYSLAVLDRGDTVVLSGYVDRVCF